MIVTAALIDSAFEFVLFFTSLNSVFLASAPPFSMLQDPPLHPSIVLFIVFPQLLIRLIFLLIFLLSIFLTFLIPPLAPLRPGNISPRPDFTDLNSLPG